VKKVENGAKPPLRVKASLIPETLRHDQSIFASLVDIMRALKVAFSWGKSHFTAWIL
jgi:hypothetical protein